MIPYNKNNEKVASFKSYKQIFRTIHKIERFKLLKRDYQPGQPAWLFQHRNHEKLFMVYCYMSGKTPTVLEREAFDKELDVIDIYRGSYAPSVQFIVTPELPVESLKKQWCRDYCKVHGYSIERVMGKSPLEMAA